MRYKVAPLGMNGTALQIVVADPYDFETLDALPHVLQPEIEFFCSTPALIKTAPIQHLRQRGRDGQPAKA
jgi:type IV pilus assembly protein PilB